MTVTTKLMSPNLTMSFSSFTFPQQQHFRAQRGSSIAVVVNRNWTLNGANCAKEERGRKRTPQAV